MHGPMSVVLKRTTMLWFRVPGVVWATRVLGFSTAWVPTTLSALKDPCTKGVTA